MAKKIVIVLLLAALVAGGVYVYMNMNDQRKVLDDEAQKIRVMDIYNEDVDMTLHTKGDYMAVEDVMKCYIADYLNVLKVFNGLGNDEKLLSMLSVENLKKDGPDMSDSLEYIRDIEEKADALEEKLVEMSRPEEILKAADTAGISDFSRKVYEEEMLTNIGVGFFYPETELDKAKTDILGKVEAVQNVVDFLSRNANGWSVNGTTVKFSDEALYQQYSELIGELKAYS